MAKKKPSNRGGTRPGAGRPRTRDDGPSESAIVRQLQAAYADAGEPRPESLADPVGIDASAVRRMLINGRCPASIAWLERLMASMGLQAVIMPVRRPEPGANGPIPTLDDGNGEG